MLAVIIPYYNGSRFIERALASVAAQSLPASEVIVVNDGSSEPERKALAELQQRYAFKIIDQSNAGQGAARNTGVAQSTADFICFLDQDDFYLPDHNATLVAAIPKDEPMFGWVYADLNRANADGIVQKERFVRDLAKHPKNDMREMLARDMFVLPSAALIARKAFNAVGGFDAQFTGYEDDDLFLRLHCAGYANRFVDRAITVWCIHTESTTYSMRMLRSRFRYYKKLDDAYPGYSPDLVARFGMNFAMDAIMTSNPHHPLRANRAEILATLDEFAERVRSDTKLPAWQRLSVRAYAAYMRSLPIVSGRVAMKLARLVF
ncbi:glycosyltransferase family A protein [Paraburkholderia sp. 22B1P]|uniref:glycosyltransferase family 2 protein n=1 Tax=Paraburkholderia sp. 22B1P TaxID=3080498 RepID=UPI00308D48C2|nr:glycosyltransferase family A protein [Paraburkholderia sp. 22B1P]